MGKIICFILSLGFSQMAWAGPDAMKCEQAAVQAQGECRGAQAQLAGQDAARSAAGSANSINIDANRLKGDIAGQSADVGAAKGKCQAAQGQCEAKCAEAMQSAQQTSQEKDPQGNPTPRAQIAMQDLQKIPGIKSSQCIGPLSEQVSKLGDAQSKLGQDQNASQNTGNNSNMGGMPGMPQMPQMGGGGDKKDQGNQQQPQQGNSNPGQNPTDTAAEKKKPTDPALGNGGFASDCQTSGTEKLPACSSSYQSLCQANPKAPGCDAYIQHHCGTGGGSTPVTNLGDSKPGQGVGTPFCTQSVTNNFCQQPGRAQCPSCMQLSTGKAPTKEAMETAVSTCPMDPLFMSRPVTTGGSTAADTSNAYSSPSSAKGSSGSGSGLGAGNAALLTDKKSGSPADDGVGYSDLANSEGGGGGGGYSYGGGSGHSNSGSYQAMNSASNSSTNKSAGSPTSAQAAAYAGPSPIARDIASSGGPGLFTLGSMAYQSFCSRSHLKNCR